MGVSPDVNLIIDSLLLFAILLRVNDVSSPHKYSLSPTTSNVTSDPLIDSEGIISSVGTSSLSELYQSNRLSVLSILSSNSEKTGISALDALIDPKSKEIVALSFTKAKTLF